MIVAVDGQLKDLDYVIDKDCSVKIFTSKNEEGLETTKNNSIKSFITKLNIHHIYSF